MKEAIEEYLDSIGKNNGDARVMALLAKGAEIGLQVAYRANDPERVIKMIHECRELIKKQG